MPQKVRLDVTQAALLDLRQIVRTTRDRWGAAQAGIYARTIREGLDRAALGLRPVRTFSQSHPGAVRVNVGAHVAIGFISRDEQDVPVFRVLRIVHKRSDLIALVDRLARKPTGGP